MVRFTVGYRSDIRMCAWRLAQSDRLPRLCMMGCRGKLTRADWKHQSFILPSASSPLSSFAKKEMEMQISKDHVKDSHEPPLMV